MSGWVERMWNAWCNIGEEMTVFNRIAIQTTSSSWQVYKETARKTAVDWWLCITRETLLSKVYLRVQSILYAGVLYMENTFLVVLHEKRYTKIKEYEQIYSYASQTCDQNVSLCNVVLLYQYNRFIQLGFVSKQYSLLIFDQLAGGSISSVIHIRRIRPIKVVLIWWHNWIIIVAKL